jgi:hypothetical protein
MSLQLLKKWQFFLKIVGNISKVKTVLSKLKICLSNKLYNF